MTNDATTDLSDYREELRGTVKPEHLPPSAPHPNHGRTVAGWTLFWILVVAATLVAIGFVIPSTTLIVIGCVLVLVGLIVGQVLRSMGLGQPRESVPRPADPHGEESR